MLGALKFARVVSLPAVPDLNTIYFIKRDDTVSVSIVGATAGDIRTIANPTEEELSDLVLRTTKSFTHSMGLERVTAALGKRQTQRIACFGDSTVDGKGTTNYVETTTSDSPSKNSPNAWPAKLQTVMNNVFGYGSAIVYNLGYTNASIVSGWANDNYTAALETNVVGTPDVCLIAFGVDEMQASSSFDSYIIYFENLYSLCVRMIAEGTLPVIMTNDPSTINGALTQKASDTERTINSAKVLVSKILRLPLIDVTRTMREWVENNNSGYIWRTLQPDKRHFGDIGHAWKAGFIAKHFMYNMIEPKPSMTVIANDPRWACENTLTWTEMASYANNRQKTYFKTTDTKTQLLTLQQGWIWNEDPNISMTALMVGKGTSPGESKGSPTFYMDNITSGSTTTSSVNWPITEDSTSFHHPIDNHLGLGRLPMGLSRLMMKNSTYTVNETYSCDLQFERISNRQMIPGGQGVMRRTDSNNVWILDNQVLGNFSVKAGDNAIILISANLPEKTGVTLFSARAFNATVSVDGDTRYGLLMAREGTSVNFYRFIGSTNGITPTRLFALNSVPIAAGETDFYLKMRLKWVTGAPAWDLINKQGVWMTSLGSIEEMPYCGDVGGFVMNSLVSDRPTINHITVIQGDN